MRPAIRLHLLPITLHEPGANGRDITTVETRHDR
jgi:hypothetical protein